MVASVIGALRVNLGLDSAQFSKGLGESSGRLTRFAAQAGKIAAGLAASFGTAMTAMGMGAINAASEIERLSQVANTAPRQFQGWAAGAKSVGVEQDKLADILKDMNDRVGDFVATGGGPMADFFTNIAPKVGVTADQFRNLSGADALQLYVSSLEKANANQQDFTFYMEAMASDSTLLLPLLKNGGKAMQEYADKASRMGAIMDSRMIASLREGKGAVSDMRLAVDGMKNTIGAQAVPIIKALAAAVTTAAMFFHEHAGTISSALRTLAGVAIAVAVAFSVKYAIAIGVTAVRAMAAAMAQSIALEMALGAQSRAAAIAGVATKGLAAAFGVLRGALISTGIGAIVVGVGYLIGKFIELVGKVGGVGNAFRLLKDVAVEIFDRIGIAFGMVPAAVSAGAAAMKSVFLGALHDMLANFAWFIASVARGMNAVLGTTLSEAEPFQETISSLSNAASNASDASAAATKRMGEAWTAATAPLQSLAALNKAVADSATAAAGSLGDGVGGAGGGLAAAADKAGDSGAGAAAKLTPLQEVLKRLREEGEKLKATLFMSDTEAAVWDNLREAKVSATSQSGKEIAALTRTNEGVKQLKESTEDWRDSLKSTFSDLLTGATSFRDALGQILQKLAGMFADSAFTSLWGAIGGDKLVAGLIGGIGANANGTNNWRGGLTRINERGGEIVDLPSGTRIIPHDVSKRMADDAGPSGGGMRVEVVPSDYFDVRVSQVADGRIGAATPSIQRGAVGQSIRANRTSKSMFR